MAVSRPSARVPYATAAAIRFGFGEMSYVD